MPNVWWTKTSMVLVAAVLSGLLIVPTFYQGQLKDGEAPPFVETIYNLFNEMTITWGLDLQGGLHLQYRVDVDKAISDRIDRYREEIGRDIRRRHEGAQFRIERIGDAPSLRIISTGSTPPRQLVNVDALAQMHLLATNEAGGSLRLDVDPAFIEETKRYAVEQAIETIRKRIDSMGVAEPSISRRGDTDIIVQLPGLDEARFEETKDIIAQTAQLEFRLVSLDSFSFLSSVALPPGIEGITIASGQLPRSESVDILRAAFEDVEPPDGTVIAFSSVERYNQSTNQMEEVGYEPILLAGSAALTGEYISQARVGNDPQTNWPVVSLEFDTEGARLFGNLTRENVDRQMAIVLDGVVRSAPNINEPILGGRCQITMGRSGSQAQVYAEAEALVIVLRNGALPAPIEKQFETQVGPTLGADTIRRGAMSLAIAFVLVFFFVLGYYRTAGIITNVALALNILFILSLLAVLGATLTLPGIAGITLTIGMAVDANVIIFERIKEERRLGKTMRASVDAGYEKALSAIVDANITTGIAGIVLLQFGSGPIKGFAVTLLIGIVCSLFTALFVTRLMFEFLLNRSKTGSISMGGNI